MTYDPNNIELDAARYRRLRVLGCAVTPDQLKNGFVTRFTNLDTAVDDDIARISSRGEVSPTSVSENEGD